MMNRTAALMLCAGVAALAIMVFAPADNQSLAVASLPFWVGLWDLTSLTDQQQSPTEWTVDAKGGGSIQRLLFSPSGQHVMTATRSGALELWDLAGNLLNSFRGHRGEIQQISFILIGISNQGFKTCKKL